MRLPFTVDQFFEVFRRYNEAVWPSQIALFLLGLGAAVLAMVRRERTSRLVSAALAFLWAWMAIEYHLRFFAAINPAAKVFAVAFLAESAALVWFGVVKRQLVFAGGSTVLRILATTLFAYSLVVYPYLGYLAGHRYPAAPTFGVPCPTTILTLGLLCLAGPGLWRVVLVVPLLWSAVGSYAAFGSGFRRIWACWRRAYSPLGQFSLLQRGVDSIGARDGRVCGVLPNTSFQRTSGLACGQP